MGKVTISRQSEATIIPNKEDVIYIDRPVEVIVEKLIEVDKIIHIPVEKEVEVIKYITTKDEQLSKRLEQLEYQLIQKDLDLKHLVSKLDEEKNLNDRVLIGVKHQLMIDRKRKLSLIKNLKKKHLQNKKLQKQMKLAIGASVVLTLLSFLIK